MPKTLKSRAAMLRAHLRSISILARHRVSINICRVVIKIDVHVMKLYRPYFRLNVLEDFKYMGGCRSIAKYQASYFLWY